jgi:hypothetical protein
VTSCIGQFEDTPGKYMVLAPSAVKSGIELNTSRVGELVCGMIVQVLEVVRRDDMNRIRARTQNPAGWISLLNLIDGNRWAEKMVRRDA